MTVGSATPEVVFQNFCKVSEFKDTLTQFEELKAVLQVTPEARSVYHSCRGRIKVSGARTLWRLLDKRAAGSAYKDGQACLGKSVLIIGAGPCGLRMAIESALLGARTVVVEMRDYVSRNNVLHLWPFVISDLKALGARVFHNKFCGGSREHASIKAIQQLMLKIALMLGVEVYAPIKFEGIQEPSKDSQGQERGWRAKFSEDHEVLRDLEFDVLVGADGKSNTLSDFKRQKYRRKLAIAITANFVNTNTPAENAVEELGGLFYIFNKPFFDRLHEKAGIQLENIVYFKDDTHYFVMTACKKSLLSKGVLKRNLSDTQQLLSPGNIDRSNLLAYARQTADLSTNEQLPELKFALDHRGREDVAIFDFTNMHHAENSCMVRERRGKQLLMAIVGDTLMEPFWPTGSGCAYGFLSVLDAAWLLHRWAAGDQPVLKVLAERETVLQLLSQTKPDNLNMRLSEYALDPRTRYGPALNRANKLRDEQVKHLYDTGESQVLPAKNPRLPPREPSHPSAADSTLNRKRLLQWLQKALKPFSDIVAVTDLTTSWSNGVALLALIQLYRPDVVDMRTVESQHAVKNNQKAFDLILEHFGVAPSISAESLHMADTADRFAILSYLTQLQAQLAKETPAKGGMRTAGKKSSIGRRFSSAGMLVHLARRTTKRTQRAQEQRAVSKRARVQKPLPPIPTRLEEHSNRTTLDKCKGIAAMRIKALTGPGDASQKSELDNSAISRSPMRPASLMSPIAPTPPARPPRPVSAVSPMAGKPVAKAPAKPPAKLPVKLPAGTENKADVCCICQKHLFVTERQNAAGYFFHRCCFRCLFCNVSLWPHDFHSGVDMEGRTIFTCPAHKPTDENDSMEDDTASSLEYGEKPDNEVEDMTMEEMAKYLSPDMMSTTGVSGLSMQGMMGMAASFATSAVAEEEESDDELSEGTQGMALSDDAAAEKGTHQHYYTLATSMRLIIGHQIQQEYEEMETEEENLEMKGVLMEKTLTSRQPAPQQTHESVGDDGLVEQWMDVLRQKQEVKAKQSKLVLKAKLLDLQERHMRLQQQLQKICMIDDLEQDMETLAALTENMSDELTDTVQQILELRLFLQQN